MRRMQNPNALGFFESLYIYTEGIKMEYDYVLFCSDVGISITMTLEMILSTLTLIFLFLWIAYRYLTKNFDYWSKQNVPFLKPRVVIGSLNWGKPLHESEKESYDKFGRVYGGFHGSQPFLSVGNPDFLKKILIKDFHVFANHRDLKCGDPVMDNSLFVLEGPDWKRVRSTISPIFTTAKLRKMMADLEACSNDVVRTFEELAENNEKIVCQRHFCKFTMCAIGRCAFGIRFSDEAQEAIARVAKDTLYCVLDWRTICILVFPKVVKWFHISLLNPATIGYFRNLMKDVVEQTKSTERKERRDFMQLLLDAEDHNHNHHEFVANGKIDDHVEHHLHTTKGLTPDETIAQCINFFMAGFDASTSLMSHAVFQLAKNEIYQDQLVTEIHKVLAENEGKLTYEAVSQMKFLDAVLSECLRICPTLVRSERRAMQDYVFEDSGITIKKDMLIGIPVFAMQRDPEWYPDADVFLPERFLSQELRPPPYTYLPFGDGPRMCLGKRFVEFSAKICLVKLFQKFKVELIDPNRAQLDIIEMRGTLKVSDVEIKLQQRC